MIWRFMKVLHCYRTFFPESQGGLEQAIFEMASNSEGSEVLTLADLPYKANFESVPVRASRRWFSLASCCVGPGLITTLFKKQADLLHLHFPWPFGDIAYLCAGRRRPLVVTYHSDIVRQRFLGAFYTPLMRWFLGKADRIVATSPEYLASSPVLQKYAHKVEVIPLGISESSYPAVAPPTLVELSDQYGRDFMLFVGALRYYKGLEYLVRASVSLPFPVLIAGKGPEEERLKRLALEVGADNVLFLGHVTDEEKLGLLKLCRAVVFPSHLRSEAFGVSLLEGLMVGKPLISTAICTGTSYVNIDQKTGHVVPPADVGALRCAMQDLWENPGKSDAWGKAARARYERLFTARKMARAYDDLYRRVLGERSVEKAVN
ncbi:glycosyltransferase [Microbulbifer sp. CAU 1566]|uniref:glycosyltransferase n=1 Tax=Microbulbifer sp. CAU 1566 TaxID=2933269 RepID=UPI00200501B6|nr:glycosyltransferase [Microbulbifer sp. CAU 1566]MCK7597347.1 glycosyltransferase [Microbulbifer sp. CAU 1566]